jgi:hypothetical protein
MINRVKMADGTELEVSSDQRDQAAAELLDLPPGATISFVRGIVWSAMRRQGLTKLSWQEFGRECIEVADGPDGEGEQSLDPGQRTRSGTAG